MAAITQPKASSPFTGQRYGSFTGHIPAIDYLHGPLTIEPYVSGEVRVSAPLEGAVHGVPHLSGKIEVNP
jgi:hypothetical protein